MEYFTRKELKARLTKSLLFTRGLCVVQVWPKGFLKLVGGKMSVLQKYLMGKQFLLP